MDARWSVAEEGEQCSRHEGEDVVWQALDLSKISKLTLRYNSETNETSAEAE